MKFRYARHTNNLKSLVEFYTNIIGLEKLGSFENHSDYNGVMLGLPKADWHLEFTESNEKAKHDPNSDDLLVFYHESEEELLAKSEIAMKAGIVQVESKNPYWQDNGIELKDPDGFGVILAVKTS